MPRERGEGGGGGGRERELEGRKEQGERVRDRGSGGCLVRPRLASVARALPGPLGNQSHPISTRPRRKAPNLFPYLPTHLAIFFLGVGKFLRSTPFKRTAFILFQLFVIDIIIRRRHAAHLLYPSCGEPSGLSAAYIVRSSAPSLRFPHCRAGFSPNQLSVLGGCACELPTLTSTSMARGKGITAD